MSSIDGLGRYGGGYTWYSVREPRRVYPEEVKGQEEEPAKQQLQLQTTDSFSQEYAATLQQDSRSRMADLENISLTFNENETFAYIGQDASLENLDMMSAISDMQKDKVLEQYQYFVGPKELGGIVAATPDGVVIQK